MTAAFLVMGFGYLLFAIVLALFLVECGINVRNTRRIDRQKREHRYLLAERDETIAALRARNRFLDVQNRALFGRCVQHPQRRCRPISRRRATTGGAT